MIFPIGAPNDGYAQFFSGKSYLAPLSTEQVGIYNVTFEPGCRNNCTSTTRKRAVGRSLCAWRDAAGIRRGASPRSCSPPVTW